MKKIYNPLKPAILLYIARLSSGFHHGINQNTEWNKEQKGKKNVLDKVCSLQLALAVN
jgi:hypothetical protein